MNEPRPSTSSLSTAVSPSAPQSPGGQGLSRRLSWTRPRPDEPGGPGSPTGMSFEHVFEDDDHERDAYPEFAPHQSTTNLVQFHDHGPDGVADDEQHLTGAAQPPWRGEEAFDEDTERSAARQPKGRYPPSSPLRSSSVGGNALRAVSRNLRRVSVRVVDLASTGTKDQAVKLKDRTEESSDPPPQDEALHDPQGTKLRGRTLAIFGPDSAIRRAMFDFLLWP